MVRACDEKYVRAAEVRSKLRLVDDEALRYRRAVVVDCDQLEFRIALDGQDFVADAILDERAAMLDDGHQDDAWPNVHVLRLVRQAIGRDGGHEDGGRAGHRPVHRGIHGDPAAMCDAHHRPEEEDAASRVAVARQLQGKAELHAMLRVDRPDEAEVVEVVAPVVALENPMHPIRLKSTNTP